MSCADAAAPVVAEVIRCVGRSDMKALRKALADAYPWRERDNAPYKVWLVEMRRQLGHPLNTPKADPAKKTNRHCYPAVGKSPPNTPQAQPSNVGPRS